MTFLEDSKIIIFARWSYHEALKRSDPPAPFLLHSRPRKLLNTTFILAAFYLR
jgi:hypothetical protein